jgi:hypothetical protein
LGVFVNLEEFGSEKIDAEKQCGPVKVLQTLALLQLRMQWKGIYIEQLD